MGAWSETHVMNSILIHLIFKQAERERRTTEHWQIRIIMSFKMSSDYFTCKSRNANIIYGGTLKL